MTLGMQGLWSGFSGLQKNKKQNKTNRKIAAECYMQSWAMTKDGKLEQHRRGNIEELHFSITNIEHGRYCGCRGCFQSLEIPIQFKYAHTITEELIGNDYRL